MTNEFDTRPDTLPIPTADRRSGSAEETPASSSTHWMRANGRTR
ncbi:hypothetical protein [Schaalia odontolytica]|nr:hypothetical protein [Schaalia odontolytica]MCQ5272714.1 hypothetical protein [Schaalia odontolytica]MCQ5282503.1 hypothetical protein [Schaalia odontolytica]